MQQKNVCEKNVFLRVYSMCYGSRCFFQRFYAKKVNTKLMRGIFLFEGEIFLGKIKLARWRFITVVDD